MEPPEDDDHPPISTLSVLSVEIHLTGMESPERYTISNEVDPADGVLGLRQAVTKTRIQLNDFLTTQISCQSKSSIDAASKDTKTNKQMRIQPEVVPYDSPSSSDNEDDSEESSSSDSD